VTKHAALGFGEWLSIAHGDAGIHVSCLCPQGVLTPMLLGADSDSGRPSFLGDGAMTAEAVAACALQGLREERFLILPHEEVLTFWQRKSQDYERWLRGMRRLRAKVMGSGGG
jgi:short-subunit dehydrogenase